MHAQPECSIKLAAAPKCEAEADAMCVLVSAASTPTRHLQVCLLLRRSRHEHSIWWSKLAAASWCEAEADARLRV